MGKDRSPFRAWRVSGAGRLSRSLALLFLSSGLLLATLSAVRAQSDDEAPVAATPSSGEYRLRGSVVNAVTGEPVRRALVQLEGEFERSKLTDSNGYFEFNGLPATHLNVTARKPGFFSDEELGLAAAQASAISVGPDTSPIVVKLTPESVIFGKVEAPDGEPAEDIPIRVISARIVDGRRRWEPRANGMSNEDGEFRVANLPPGVYYVEAGPGASFRLRRTRLAAAEEGYSTAFYPGASDPTAAAPIVLSPGQQQEVQFSLKPQPLFRLSGIIRGYPPGMDVEIDFVDQIGEQLVLPTQLDQQTGKFSTRIPAGVYTLRARAQDNRQQAAADVPLSVNGDLTGVQVVLGPGISVPVVVRRERSGQGEDAASRIRAPIVVHLSSTDSPLSSLDYWSAPDPQAGLAVRNVTPGKYSVEVTAGGSWYVQSMTCAGTDLLQNDLAIAPGGQPPPIEIVVRDDGATLTGAVQVDGNPEKGIALLVPEPGSAAQARVASAAQAGAFRFDHVAPGDYRVMAFDRVDDLEYRNPQVLDAYRSRGVHVTLQANGQSSTTVELIKVER